MKSNSMFINIEISVIYQFWTNLIFQIIDYLPENLVKTAVSLFVYYSSRC